MTTWTGNDALAEAEVMEQSQAMVKVERPGAIGILRPADSLDRIAEAFKEYQHVCETILDANDYQAYEGKARKKKSAWRKLAVAFNVSTSIVAEEIVKTAERHVLSANYRVKAYTGPKSNPYRELESVGYCDINEKCCASARGEKCHKAAWKGHFCCKNGCDGRRHWSHPDHDVMSTAETRASNRAIANLIGCGEVSAEELTDEGEAHKAAETPPRRAEAPKPPSTPNPAPKTAPKPAQAQPKAPTDATRKWMLDSLKASPGMDHRQLVTEFMVKAGKLMPNEEPEALSLQWVASSHSQLRELGLALAHFEAGEEAKWPYPANTGEVPPPPTKPEGKKPEAPDEPWRSFPMPFGKQAGIKLADLDKKYLFGLWANYEVETEYQGKPKKPETIAKDTVFRQMLDAAGVHYEFKKP